MSILRFLPHPLSLRVVVERLFLLVEPAVAAAAAILVVVAVSPVAPSLVVKMMIAWEVAVVGDTKLQD